MRFLGSQRYVKSRLEDLSPSALAELRAIFAHNGHPMFREALGTIRHAAGETPKNYADELEKTDLEKMARLIKIVGILLQSKVYLFWGLAE